jgi:hypothetical protein
MQAIAETRKTDIKPAILNALEESETRPLLERILAGISEPEDLIRFIHRYTVFNGNFAGGVANLAGAFHVQQRLFRDANETIADCADRSSEIASYIFLAAEDEYAVRNGGPRWTHRGLGQLLLKATLQYFGVGDEQFSKSFPLTPTIDGILEEVIEGYKINKADSEPVLFGALGFHIGAELLADVEFNVIHGYLEDRYSGLIQHLRGRDIGHGVNAYHWIQLHTSVEEEHFDGAIVAAEKALQYYVGARSVEAVQGEVLEGFWSFVRLQQRFFRNVLEHPSS